MKNNLLILITISCLLYSCIDTNNIKTNNCELSTDILDSINLNQILKNDPLFLTSIKIKNKFKSPILVSDSKENFVYFNSNNTKLKSEISFIDSNYNSKDIIEPFNSPFSEEAEIDALKRYQNEIEVFKNKGIKKTIVYNGKNYYKINSGDSLVINKVLKLFVNDYNYLIGKNKRTYLSLKYLILNGDGTAKVKTTFSKKINLNLKNNI